MPPHLRPARERVAFEAHGAVVQDEHARHFLVFHESIELVRARSAGCEGRERSAAREGMPFRPRAHGSGEEDPFHSRESRFALGLVPREHDCGAGGWFARLLLRLLRAADEGQRSERGERHDGDQPPGNWCRTLMVLHGRVHSSAMISRAMRSIPQGSGSLFLAGRRWASSARHSSDPDATGCGI